MILFNKTAKKRFWAKVAIKLPSECWEWQGYVMPQGYGQFGANGKHSLVLAHRMVYEFEVGKIPEGLTIDHLCYNRRCVNPAHLEAVTMKENILRADAASINRNKTHCPKGHAYDQQNTYVGVSGSRFCRACRNLRYRHVGTPMAQRTHCPQGHAYTPENTITFRGSRNCLACKRRRSREYVRRKRHVH
jgi:hypothetical protein